MCYTVQYTSPHIWKICFITSSNMMCTVKFVNYLSQGKNEIEPKHFEHRISQSTSSLPQKAAYISISYGFEYGHNLTSYPLFNKVLVSNSENFNERLCLLYSHSLAYSKSIGIRPHLKSPSVCLQRALCH